MTKIPPLITVDSSSVRQVGHSNETLFVRYNDNRLVRYPGVTVEQYVKLGEAGNTYRNSMLRYLREAILPGVKGIEVEE
jgi:hypothetical protein